MNTDPDIIDQAAEEMHSYECPEDPDPGETCTCDTGHYDRLARILADAGLLREPDQQRNGRMAADAKVYADLEDARAERDKAIAERNMAVGKVDETRQRLAQVRAVVADLDAPNPEADQDWHDDPVGCIRDALHIALDGEAQS